MPVRQWEIDGRCGVVDRGAQPTIKRVARIAGLGELTGHMVRTLGLLKITHVAGVACCGQSLELAHRRAFVTVFALHRSMRSHQRKTVLVIFHLLDGDVPALHRVALCAIRPHFPLVDVRVAVFAILPYIGEYGLDVALRALHFFVHAAKRIFGFVVVEFRHRSNGTPARRVVAVLARNGQRSVRTSARLPLRGVSLRCGWQTS